MTIKDKLNVMKKRHRKLHNAVAYNERACVCLAHKSRNLRKNSMSGLRKNFFRDLEIELGYAIEFLEGRSTEKEYLAVQVGG